jgi:hypothetical protein
MNNAADTTANDYSWEDIPLSMAFAVHEHGLTKSTGIVKQQMEYIMGKKQKQMAEKRF